MKSKLTTWETKNNLEICQSFRNRWQHPVNVQSINVPV